MRTTLTINDELLREAKELAARRQSNVSAIVNEALRTVLHKEQDKLAKQNKYRTIVYSPPDAKVGQAAYLSPIEMKDMLAAEEMEPYGDK